MSLCQTKILENTEEAITLASKIIVSGDVVAVPTETVYGLAADATNASAIDRIYEAKERPKHNPLIVHVGRDCDNLEALEAKGYTNFSSFSLKAKRVTEQLINEFWPGPLTLVLPRGKDLSPMVARRLDTVGFRMPKSKIFLDLIEKSRVPLAAPSANKANSISPTTAEHVYEELSGAIPLILKGEQSQVGIESTILAVSPTGSLKLLRPGGLAIETIEETVGFAIEVSSPEEKIQAPGMMSLHYSPKKPLLLLNEIPEGIDEGTKDLLVIGEFIQENSKKNTPSHRSLPYPVMTLL